MISSLYILSSKNVILLEKHWKSVIDKSVYRHYLDLDSDKKHSLTVSPVIIYSKFILVHLTHSDVVYLAICEREVNPLLVMEFLNRVVQVIESYFKSTTETTIEENLVCVYEILDEMIDYGVPLVTEFNILEELVRPPTFIRNLTDQVTRQSTNVSSVLPVSQLSIVPWRRVGVKYPHNEALFDFEEVIDAIVDKNGTTVLTEISGKIKSNIRLSGMPDVVMRFNNPRLIDDLSFHPCVRFSRWNQDKVLSFVPPDGAFELCSYYVNSNSCISLPITLKSLSKIDENRSFLDLTVIGNKTCAKKHVENLIVTVHLPSIVSNVNTKTCSHGKTNFNALKNQLVWNIGRLDVYCVANLKGPVALLTNTTINRNYSIDITADFKIDQSTLSGISVEKVEIYNEKYSPYKGVKYVTTSGNYQLRA